MIKMSLLVILGLAAVALLRHRSAAVRHWVLAAALVCAAATPLLERIVPVWHLPISTSLFGRRVEPLALLIPVHEREGGAAEDDAGPTPRFVPVQTHPVMRAIAPIWAGGFSCV